MAETTLLADAFLIDRAGEEPREQASLAIEGDRISRVFGAGSRPSGGWDRVVDCSGIALMPGLTDAHVHIGAVDVNILDQHRERPSNLTALLMARILEDTLMQGFTTVRDAGGADWSFKAAAEQGVIEGPRLLVSDKPLSQTGGHGDWRQRSETQPPEIFCPTAGIRAVVCDGVDEIRRAARAVASRGRPDQGDGERGRHVPRRRTRGDPVPDRGAKGRRRGGRSRHDLRDGPRLQRRRRAQLPGGGRPLRRARQPHKRGDGRPDVRGRRAYLVPTLVSTTRTNAELFGSQDEIGTVEGGKVADLLVVDGDPPDDISVLQKRDNLRLIVEDGRVVEDELGG